jgi:hypothetical protein
MTLPKMDVPINVVEWELFVPEQFKVDRFDGRLIDADLVARTWVAGGVVGGASRAGYADGVYAPQPARAGQIVGRLTDQTGAALPGAQVTIESGGHKQVVLTAADGSFVASDVPSGRVNITGELQGFQAGRRSVQFDQTGQRVDMNLSVAGATETVNVMAATPGIDTRSSSTPAPARPPQNAAAQKKDENEAPSQNVQNLQRRVAGVLPVRVDVPRAGTSHRFVKPLVIDEETGVTFRYRRR